MCVCACVYVCMCVRACVHWCVFVCCGGVCVSKALKKKVVVVLESTSIGLPFPLLYIPAVFLESSKVYEVLSHMLLYVVVPKVHPLSPISLWTISTSNKSESQ